MKNKLMLVMCGAAVACICLFGADCYNKSGRIYTVTQYSVSGEKIGEWKNARIVKGRRGWCTIETPDGKLVMIDGPHRWEEQ